MIEPSTQAECHFLVIADGPPPFGEGPSTAGLIESPRPLRPDEWQALRDAATVRWRALRELDASEGGVPILEWEAMQQGFAAFIVCLNPGMRLQTYAELGGLY